MIRSKKLRDSAKGKPCTLQIVEVCNGDWSTTVLAHLPDESHGMAKKSDDISSCYGCSDCHAVIDGRAPWPKGEDACRDFYLRRAQTRTLRMMFEDNLISIKGS